MPSVPLLISCLFHKHLFLLCKGTSDAWQTMSDRFASVLVLYSCSSARSMLHRRKSVSVYSTRTAILHGLHFSFATIDFFLNFISANIVQASLQAVNLILGQATTSATRVLSETVTLRTTISDLTRKYYEIVYLVGNSTSSIANATSTGNHVFKVCSHAFHFHSTILDFFVKRTAESGWVMSTRVDL